MIAPTSSLEMPGITAEPSLTLMSSWRSPSLHSSPGGGGKYFIFFTSCLLNVLLSALHSKAILLTVLPTSVLLSLYTKLDRYLMLPFRQVLRDPKKLTNREHNRDLGCLIPDTASIWYLWVVQGRSKTLLMVTFHDENSLVT